MKCLMSVHMLSKATKQLDAHYILQHTQNKIEGIQQFIPERLRVRMHYMLVKYRNTDFQSRHICIKITGDGTSISRVFILL